MSQRTVRDFYINGDVWQVIAAWANKEQFKLVTSDPNQRMYQRGRDTFDFRIILEVRQLDGQVHLEAWVRASPVDRTRTLFMVPSEMGLESGGMQMLLPRRAGRTAVNKLLTELGQPLIP